MAMPASGLDARIQGLLPELDRVYTDLHAHPELSMQEIRTAGIAADRLRGAGYEVTDGIGQGPAASSWRLLVRRVFACALPAFALRCFAEHRHRPAELDRQAAPGERHEKAGDHRR
jgi:hypothetical protein